MPETRAVGREIPDNSLGVRPELEDINVVLIELNNFVRASHLRHAH